MKGKGVPSTRYKDVRGDHYVTFVIQTPEKLSHEAKDLLKKFDELTGDSLNAVARAGEASKDSEDKKKKFWK